MSGLDAETIERLIASQTRKQRASRTRPQQRARPFTQIPHGEPTSYRGSFATVDMLDCSYCGSCPDPEHCVWSVVCPVCGAEPTNLCSLNGRIVPLHPERWFRAENLIAGRWDYKLYELRATDRLVQAAQQLIKAYDEDYRFVGTEVEQLQIALEPFTHVGELL